ncbi:MAG TPA: 2-dehydropantoate 2-reductase [Chloroflexota bacterium]|nr:2-dehydropantoate 2-reductase [Chloroflexota bacterium]
MPEVTIVGAGAIGGTLGAYLARAGRNVCMVDKVEEHVRAMRERGLTIEAYDGTFTVPVKAATVDELTGPLGLVVLAVKAQDTAAAMESLLPLLGPDSTVVSFQNGLCERTIAEMIGPERTVGCFVNYSADYLAPGVITYGGAGAVYLGELDGTISDRVRELQDLFSAWGNISVTDNIWGYLWGKMGYANMLFATALADETMADVTDRFRPLMIELAAEIYEVADREGVRLETFDAIEPALYYPRENQDPDALNRSLDRLTAWQRSNKKVKSGIWRDLAVRHRKTEVDEQTARAVEIGARHGLPMPLTRAVIAMIHELEDGTREMSWGNLDELDALRSAEAAAARS